MNIHPYISVQIMIVMFIIIYNNNNNNNNQTIEIGRSSVSHKNNARQGRRLQEHAGLFEGQRAALTSAVIGDEAD